MIRAQEKSNQGKNFSSEEILMASLVYSRRESRRICPREAYIPHKKGAFRRISPCASCNSDIQDEISCVAVWGDMSCGAEENQGLCQTPMAGLHHLDLLLPTLYHIWEFRDSIRKWKRVGETMSECDRVASSEGQGCCPQRDGPKYKGPQKCH